MGDPKGECAGEKGELLVTYECFGFSAFNCFSMSSWCTATLKRFQNCGSRIMVKDKCRACEVRWVAVGVLIRQTLRDEDKVKKNRQGD